MNIGLKIIFGSSNIHLDHVLANKIFLISFIDFWDIIRLRCKSDDFLHSITNAHKSDNILKNSFAYQKKLLAKTWSKCMFELPNIVFNPSSLVLAVPDKILRYWWNGSETFVLIYQSPSINMNQWQCTHKYNKNASFEMLLKFCFWPDKEE